MAFILADDIFNCIFLNENDRIRIQISLRYVPRSPDDNKAALVQIMAWRQAIIVNWIITNKLQGNFNQNTKLLIGENASENIVSEMAVILTRRGEGG